MLGPEDLVISGATLGNPPFRELVEAARAGGFAGVSLWPPVSYAPARAAGHSDAELRALLDDNGIAVSDVDAIVTWAGPDDPGAPYLEEAPEKDVFAAAEALGAPCCNVIVVGKPPVSIEDAAEAFGRVCDRARARGLTTYLEFSPGSAIRDAANAKRMLELADRPQSGLLLDTWHCHHGPTRFDDLRALPGDRVLGVQISDVPPERPADLPWATRHGRLVPGRGVFDLVGFVQILREIGSPAPLTLEVLSDELVATHSAADLSRLLGDALRSVLSRV